MAAIVGPDGWPDRQTGPCWSSWMSSGTTSVYPTSLFLVLVCVPVTPDNEVTWWSIASVAGRERNAENHVIQCAFRQTLCSAEAALLAALFMLPPGHTMDSVLKATPQASVHTVHLCASMDLDRAIRNMGRSGMVHGLASASSVWLMGSSPMPTSHDLVSFGGYWGWAMR